MTRPSRPIDAAPGRFAQYFRTDSPKGCQIALLGLPDDLGVKLNNGRPGACDGPSAFRAALTTFGADFDATTGKTLDVRVYDAGDVIPAEGDDATALDETHRRTTQAVAALHALDLVPICIGGGHDLTFPAVRALSEHVAGVVGGVNVDAHLDVRKAVGSGMSFRRLIDDSFLDARRFVTLGAGRFSNSRQHVQWLRQQGGAIILSDDLLLPCPPGEGRLAHNSFDSAIETAFPSSGSVGFVSIDLDVIDAAQAPGVSAMNPSGLPAHLVCEIVHRAGADARVRHFDIMEMSPPLDDPPSAGRTARLAALIFLSFIAGFARRTSD